MQLNYSGTGIDLTGKDQQYIWHPFTPLEKQDQILIERGEGVWLYTSDGRKILDGISSWWVNLFGHSHPHIAEAVARQAANLEHVIFAGFTHEPAITLAETILKILPGNFSKVFFSDNGSTSVEVALKMAIQYWFNKKQPKKKIIALEGAYHGDTFGAMSAGGRSLFTRPFENYLFEVDFIPFPSGENGSLAVESFKKLCEKGDVAVFIYEPLIQGTAGMRVYEPENLEALLEVAQKYDVITIADEVFTGFGRTGKYFASEYMSISPDLITLSKGITGGFLPLGLTCASPKIEEAFKEAKAEQIFFHGHSYTGNPIACAAANASLELLLMQETVEKIKLIERLQAAFAEEIQSHEKAGRVDHLGTILSLEVKTSENSGYHNNIRNFLYNFFLEHNILLRPLGNVVYIVPPLVAEPEHLKILHESVQKMLKILQ